MKSKPNTKVDPWVCSNRQSYCYSHERKHWRMRKRPRKDNQWNTATLQQLNHHVNSSKLWIMSLPSLTSVCQLQGFCSINTLEGSHSVTLFTTLVLNEGINTMLLWYFFVWLIFCFGFLGNFFLLFLFFPHTIINFTKVLIKIPCQDIN